MTLDGLFAKVLNDLPKVTKLANQFERRFWTNALDWFEIITA